jgi:MYXO-CTERM domain-containing protein
MTRLTHFGFLVGLLAGAAALSSACGDTTRPQEKLGRTTLALDTGLDGGPSLALLNELKVNPADNDQPFEYVELRGTPGASLAGFYFVSVEGDAAGAGTADFVVDLGTACGGPCSFGTNGLLVIKAATGGHTVPTETTVAGVTKFDAVDGGSQGIENDSNSFLLVFSPLAPIVQGTDYDGDAGALALPTGAVIVDAIGYRDATTDFVYGGAEIPYRSSAEPDGITRFPGDDTPISAGAWYGGDLVGSNDSVSYSTVPTERTFNFPEGGALTPGAPNVGIKGTDGGLGPDVSLPDVVVMPDTALPDVASEVAMDAVSPPVDTAPTVDAPVDTAVAVDTGAPTDTGTASTDTGTTTTDTGSAVEDTGTEPEDTGTPPLVTDTGTAATDTGNDVAPVDTAADEGCSCTTPKSTSSEGAALAALALGIVFASRRRR